MTDPAAIVDDYLARQARARERLHAIVSAPEAAGRKRLAFALACRFDLPVMRVRALLAGAPELATLTDIMAWVDAVPTRPALEIVS